MLAVLGIDAAWTLHNPSGVALAVGQGRGWRLIAVEASYSRFIARAHGCEPEARPTGSKPDPKVLLEAARKLAGADVDLIAIDMPLSHEPITGRRPSDRAISSAYGARRCATHSPSALRPGRISDDLRAGFDELGYRLHTDRISGRGLIEVYPHPALVELANAPVRLPYKAAKSLTYWPDATVEDRRKNLRREWRRIVGLLDREMHGVADLLPMPRADARGQGLKAFEDSLDAVVCAWIAACALDGNCQPFGDATSAVWVPKSRNSQGNRG